MYIYYTYNDVLQKIFPAKSQFNALSVADNRYDSEIFDNIKHSYLLMEYQLEKF